MNHRFVLSLASVAAAIWLFFAPSAQAAKFHALLIANSDYQDTGWADLKTPDNDVDALQSILQQQYGFTTEILRNATRSQIIDRIEILKMNVGEDDSLLIYFAGHGILRPGDGGYWVGVDASTTSRSGWLKYDVIDDLIDYQAGMKARHVMVVADSCYSGAALRSRGDFADNPADSRAQLLSRRFNQRSRTVMTSGGTEPVLDSVASNDHSVFAAEFLGKLRANREVLDGNALFTRIEPEVFGRAQRVLGSLAQAPEYGALKGIGHDGGDFVFVPVGMSLPDELSTPKPNPSPFGLRGPTAVVHENRSGPIHLGDENIGSWPALRGQCYDMSFNYAQKIETVTLGYEVYGAESTYVEVAGIRHPFEAMLPLAGKKRPNYWADNRQISIQVGRTFTEPVNVRICSQLVSNPEFQGDLDDFQVRNITLRVN